MVNSNAILSATERASASSAMTDSLVARPLAKAARAAFAPAAASGARPADNVARLEAVTATGLAEGARCFQLGSLTTDSAFGALPQRFALAGASTTRNVVRSLSAEGRIDSIVPGAEWVQPASNEVIIEFPVAGGVGRMVRLDLGQGRATTQMAAGTAKTVSFSRIDCAR
jgi:hypothetical protein